jgi:hypothetical protein
VGASVAAAFSSRSAAPSAPRTASPAPARAVTEEDDEMGWDPQTVVARPTAQHRPVSESKPRTQVVTLGQLRAAQESAGDEGEADWEPRNVPQSRGSASVRESEQATGPSLAANALSRMFGGHR